MRYKRGSIGGYLVIIVMLLMIFTSIISSSVLNSTKISYEYYKITKAENEFQTIKARKLFNILRSNTGNSTFNQYSIKINPIKIETPQIPDYNDDIYYEPVYTDKVIGYSEDNSINDVLYKNNRNYVFYSLFHPLNYEGIPFDAFFVYRGADDLYLSSLINTFSNDKVLYLGLSEWNIYKWNGVYELEIYNNESQKSIKSLIHITNNDLQELIYYIK